MPTGTRERAGRTVDDLRLLCDGDLVGLARGGESTAFVVLFARHRAAALGFARGHYGESRADDLVSEAFLRILGAVRRGGGPGQAFRPYLYVTIRHLAQRPGPAATHEVCVDPQALVGTADESRVEGADPGSVEVETIRRAFADLPERWQVALWHSAVEQEPLEVIGRRLGLKPTAVASLTYRARNGLREAFLAHQPAARQAG